MKEVEGRKEKEFKREVIEVKVEKERKRRKWRRKKEVEE